MNTSQTGIDLIKSFEGLSLTAYVCPSGVLTIGYGHTGDDVKPGQKVTAQQAEKILKGDLTWAENAVSTLVKIPLNQNQFDALVSFTFNSGQGALGYSTLLKRLNKGEDPCTVVKQELPRWVKGEGSTVLSGLVRRRSAEIELFCKPESTHLTGTVTITSKQQTWLKKSPVEVAKLPSSDKALVVQKRTIKSCKVLNHRNGHTQLELGFGLGTWWVFDNHWDGLKTELKVVSCSVENGVHSLRDFPYFWQVDNGVTGWRECQTSAIATVLKYLDVKGINDDKDYLKVVNKYGDTTTRSAHFSALAELNVSAQFTKHLCAEDVKEQIDKGLPVVGGILHHGPVDQPLGGGHFIVLSGYSDSYWLVQDPFGELDLINGMWASTAKGAGKNQHYSFKNMNPRFFVGGKCNGWGWHDFKYNG